MINIDTYGPRPDISGHHPGLRAKFLVSQAIWSPPEPSQSKKLQINVVYMININTYGPRPDISGHHPGLRAKFLVSQAIWSPPEPSQSKKLLINVVYMININTYGPGRTFPDITQASGPSSW